MGKGSVIQPWIKGASSQWPLFGGSYYRASLLPRSQLASLSDLGGAAPAV